jgi:hypothetical protein
MAEQRMAGRASPRLSLLDFAPLLGERKKSILHKCVIQLTETIFMPIFAMLKVGKITILIIYAPREVLSVAKQPLF